MSTKKARTKLPAEIIPALDADRQLDIGLRQSGTLSGLGHDHAAHVLRPRI
jgi:hypothetical protein